MKHPILKTKKDALIYDDTAQRQSPQAYPASTRNPIRAPRRTRHRKRRGGLTFLPLLVLAFGLVIVFQVIPRSPQDRATLAGWQAVLRATRAGEKLIVGVTFIAEQSTIVSPVNRAEATVQILIPGTGDRMTLSGPLQRSPITLRGELAFSARMSKVQAEVSLLDAHAALRVAVP